MGQEKLNNGQTYEQYYEHKYAGSTSTAMVTGSEIDTAANIGGYVAVDVINNSSWFGVGTVFVSPLD